MVENIFYNYVYLDPRKPGNYNYGEFHFDYEPFLIGKGKDNRIYEHLYEKKETTYNLHKVRKINKIKESGLEPIIFKIFENLDEKTALDNERTLITLIGKSKDKKGPLTNITDGGEGGGTWKFLSDEQQIILRKFFSERSKKFWANISDEKRKEIIDKKTGKNNSCFNIPRTDEVKEKIRKKLIGENSPNYGKHPWNYNIPCSDEVKEKIRKKLIGENNPNYGKKLSQYQIDAIKKANTGENNYSAVEYTIELPNKEIISIKTLIKLEEYLNCTHWFSTQLIKNKEYKGHKLIERKEINDNM